MDLVAFAEHYAPVVVIALGASIGFVLRYRSSALLVLIAGLVAIFGRNERSRADRALDVMRALRGQETRRPDKPRRSRLPPTA